MRKCWQEQTRPKWSRGHQILGSEKLGQFIRPSINVAIYTTALIWRIARGIWSGDRVINWTGLNWNLMPYARLQWKVMMFFLRLGNQLLLLIRSFMQISYTKNKIWSYKAKYFWQCTHYLSALLCLLFQLPNGNIKIKGYSRTQTEKYRCGIRRTEACHSLLMKLAQASLAWLR